MGLNRKIPPVSEAPSPLRQAGITQVQLLVSIVILGILGGTAVSKWSQAGRKQALILQGKTLRAFFQAAKAHGVKKSLQVGIRCDAAANACGLFEDRNANGLADAGETVRSEAFSNGIAIGIAQNGPASGPGGLSAPASGLAGAWTQAWTAPVDLAAPAPGALYLRHGRLPILTVCLYARAGSQQASLALWNGKEWVDL